MRKFLVSILPLLFLVPAAQAADKGWPDDMADVHAMVKAKFGNIAFNRVKVERDGKATQVSIKLKHIPRQFRAVAEKQAGDESLFLATAFVELFEPDFDIFGFDLFPIADFVTYYYGFVAFNFDKPIKRYAEISVFGADFLEVQNIKKKLKLKKNSVLFRWVEGTVSAPGLYVLYTELGPYSLENYFCSSCK